MKDCNLFFFDCETGGLNPAVADMVEVACIVTDPSGQLVLNEYSAKVIPKKPVDAGAARINGYTTEKWAAEAIDLDIAMVKMLGLGRDAVFVAHNTPFDWSFFEMAMAQRSQRWNGDYHKIDTVALATPLLKAGHVPNLKLVTLSAHFGIEHEAHRAMGDARACREVYLKLMEMYASVFPTVH
jgi:DNA polymerase III epsilon subunit-like protein